MNIDYPPDVADFRTEVRAFLERELPEGWRGLGHLDEEEARAFTAWWRTRLAESGYLTPSWPREYGGAGLSRLQQVVLAEEFAAAGVPLNGKNDVFSIKMIGNLLLRYGTEEQQRRFLPRIVSGEDRWCQGFSEPGAGSDLAGLRTRARLEDDTWVIDGQKIWTSDARTANWIFVLVRSDPDASRHRGITMLLVPMDQPGITVRPISMLSGGDNFNEVYFDGARTARENVVIGPGEGWTAAMALLGLERGDEAATNPIYFQAEVDRLIALAKERGHARDGAVRDDLARAYTRAQIMRYLGMQTLTGWLAGKTPGRDASISKLYWSEHHRKTTDLAVDLLGAEALAPTGRRPIRHYRADDPDAPNSSGSWVGTWMIAISGTIYAGTSEIQRNILAESVLGLPKEPRPV
ncbi:acyl-CoA dehydrogenase family protein [Nocardia flavorosea]|uniref:Acyl-CoA dehydrogenase n=1 Tax=Nocardia flavorosea TaxID=53429 RepID=A0A846YS31_9NOCA|nr:acyl-CoA dehydrogenase family protein [Nocardia flavorosea]NKY60491.1 acyl-CoA dehydrogenase [Nocardia flavorosea]